MMVLSSSDTPAIRKAIKKFPQYIGHFIGPRVYYTRRSLQDGHGYWAADNDCFNPCGFQLMDYLKMLRHNHRIRDRCLFILAPDIVGNAKQTLLRFWAWAIIIKLWGFPVALAAQDGLENLRVPWFLMDALFIGGTTEWKLSQAAVDLIKEAKKRGKWIHVGRVNSQKRFLFCFHAGADSVDGTTFGIASDLSLRWALPLLRSLDLQLSLEGFE